jgi:2-dehydro-3-deoxyphosphogluconate aldolase/(4S)-4-hydroxy-2-oxoglutarate aldolase
MASHFAVLNRLLAGRIVAIVRLDTAGETVAVARALKAGGIDCIEFTMTTPGALETVAAAVKEFGDEVLLGVGTVLDPETARAAILAGAQFVVTPSLKVETIELCRRYGRPIAAGALTPTEILTAWEAGADLVKVFPADAMGPNYIRAVLAPLPQVRLVPTGGISAANAADYMRAGAAALGAGGKLVDKAAIARGDFATLTAEARALVAAVQEASGHQT